MVPSGRRYGVMVVQLYPPGPRADSSPIRVQQSACSATCSWTGQLVDVDPGASVTVRPTKPEAGTPATTPLLPTDSADPTVDARLAPQVGAPAGSGWVGTHPEIVVTARDDQTELPREFRLETSSDGGTTWRTPETPALEGGSLLVSLPIPKAAGVSRLAVRVTDQSQRSSVVDVGAFTAVLDDSPPTATVTAPANPKKVAAWSPLRGTVSDNREVEALSIVLIQRRGKDLWDYSFREGRWYERTKPRGGGRPTSPVTGTGNVVTTVQVGKAVKKSRR